MIRLSNFFVPTIVACLLLVSACGADSGASKRYPDYRYRLTVEVETPEGVKAGSSVIEVQTVVAGKYSIPNAGWVSSRVRGEAVTVDLGKRGMMFALLRSEYSEDWAKHALQSVTRPVTYKESKAAGLSSKYSPTFDLVMQRTLALTGKHQLPRFVDEVTTRADVRNKGGELPSAYPILVTFKNLNDPTSLTAVNSDNLAATFGTGVKLKRITVERTDDKVTMQIEQHLSWLKLVGQQRGTLIPNPPRYLKDTNIIQLIGSNDFSTELYK